MHRTPAVRLVLLCQRVAVPRAAAVQQIHDAPFPLERVAEGLELHGFTVCLNTSRSLFPSFCPKVE